MPRKLDQPQKLKNGDVQPVKDFDYIVNAEQGQQTLANFALRAGAIPNSQNNQKLIGGLVTGGNVLSYLQNRGDLEKEIIKKGISKAQAQQAAAAQKLNYDQYNLAKQKEKEKMNARRQKIDLSDGIGGKDIYGGRNVDQGFENDGLDDFMGGQDGGLSDLLNDPGYQRLNNGMGVNENLNDMKKQNQKIAKKGAMLALGTGDQNEDLFDNRSLSEYYAELFSYAPAILNEANKNGNQYERFKLSIKFAFSIIHCMALQDVIQKKPIIPILGETYEGLYVMPEGHVSIFMESDYIDTDIQDIISNNDKCQIKKDQETTYIHIEGPKCRFQIFGNLSYNQTWKGNNMIISLLGTLTLKFLDIEGDNQSIKIQLPDYVLANYIYTERKPRVSLISGSMVLVDEKNGFKSVIFIRGLIKKKSLFQTSFEPNLQKNGEKLIEGIIYKINESISKKGLKKVYEKLDDLEDIEFELAQVSGQAIDKPVIQNIPYSNWAGVHFADPIPQELALPSDIRFREDLLFLRKGEGGKGKVMKGKLTKKDKEKKKEAEAEKTEKKE